MAEWPCSGLQIRLPRFDSGTRLQYLSPGGGIGRHKGFKIPRRTRCAGSSPAPGTILKSIDVNRRQPTSIFLSEPHGFTGFPFIPYSPHVNTIQPTVAVNEVVTLIALGKQAGFSLMEIAGMFDLEGKPIPDRGRLAAKAREIDKTIQPLTSIYA